MKPCLEPLEERSLLALIAVLGTGTDPVGPLVGHVLTGTNVVTSGQPGDIDVSSFGHDTATASIALQWDAGAKILPVCITGSNAISSDDYIAAGIYYAIKHKASVISISFASAPQLPGSLEDPVLFDALNKAELKNIPVVVAAGNSTSNNDINPTYPSNDSIPFRNVISVAAYDKNNVIASFSNYGSHSVTVGALGVNVTITTLSGAESTASGTSFATPMVAGLIGRIRDLMPHASMAKIQGLLKGFATSPNTVTADHGAIL